MDGKEIVMCKARIKGDEVRCGSCGVVLGRLTDYGFDTGPGWHYVGGRPAVVDGDYQMVDGHWEGTTHARRGWRHAHKIVAEGLGTAQEIERYRERLKAGLGTFARPEPMHFTDRDGDEIPAPGTIDRAAGQRLPATVLCFSCNTTNEVRAR
jgi:hypothetical protein